MIDIAHTQNILISHQGGHDATQAFLHAHSEDVLMLTLGVKGLKESVVGMLEEGAVVSAKGGGAASFANRQGELGPCFWRVITAVLVCVCLACAVVCVS